MVAEPMCSFVMSKFDFTLFYKDHFSSSTLKNTHWFQFFSTAYVDYVHLKSSWMLSKTTFYGDFGIKLDGRRS